MSVDLIICICGTLLFAAEMVFFFARINRAKKIAAEAEREIPPVKGQLKGIIACAVALLLLPILVPLQTYVTAVVCACAVLGPYAVLKERLDLIRGLGNESGDKKYGEH